MKYKLDNTKHCNGALIRDGHTMFLEDVLNDINFLQAENIRLQSALTRIDFLAGEIGQYTTPLSEVEHLAEEIEDTVSSVLNK